MYTCQAYQESVMPSTNHPLRETFTITYIVASGPLLAMDIHWEDECCRI